MKKIVVSVCLFIICFFFLNVQDVNTIDDIAFFYSKESMNEEKVFRLNFYKLNIYELDSIFNDLDIKILSIKPMHYSESIEYSNTLNVIDEYSNELLKNGNYDSSISIKLKGFLVESVSVLCTTKEVINLEKRIGII